MSDKPHTVINFGMWPRVDEQGDGINLTVGALINWRFMSHAIQMIMPRFNNNINVYLFVNKFSTWACVDMDILKCSRHECTFFILIAVYGMGFSIMFTLLFAFHLFLFRRRENCFIVGPFYSLDNIAYRQCESQLNHILYGHNFDIKP